MRTFVIAAACIGLLAFGLTSQAQEVEVRLDFNAADTNSDGKLSKDETTTAITGVIANQLKDKLGEEAAKQVAKQAAPQTVKALFEQFDKNLDGFLTEQELASTQG